MNKENTEKLFAKYPKIFVQHSLSPQETAMCWGIDCGDGWFWLIDNLCSHLQFDIERNNHSQIEAVQVKEKFGDLRFYTNHADESQQSMINFAEFLSNSICENCGSTNNVSQNNKGWINTLCKHCWDEKGKNIND